MTYKDDRSAIGLGQCTVCNEFHNEGCGEIQQRIDISSARSQKAASTVIICEYSRAMCLWKEEIPQPQDTCACVCKSLNGVREEAMNEDDAISDVSPAQDVHLGTIIN